MKQTKAGTFAVPVFTAISLLTATFTLSGLLMSPWAALAAPVRPQRATSSSDASGDVESQQFLSGLRGRVLNNWLLPDGINTVVLEATVNPAGDVVDVQTAKSTADVLAVQAAQEAFNKAQPLGHLPAKYKSDCKIVLTFTTKVDPHGDSTSNLGSQIEPIVNTGGQSSAAGTSGQGQPAGAN
jgi:TonB family protein